MQAKPKKIKNKGKPKLLYIITKSNWGGAQKYVYDLATSDIRNRFDVIVMTGGRGELVERLEKEGIKVVTLKNLGRDVDLLKDVRSLFELVKNIKEISPDIVHLNSSKIGFFGAMICRLLKIKAIIFTAHGWPFNEERNFISKFIFRVLMQVSVLLSTRTIAVSESTVKSLRPLQRVKNKMQVIYNGIKKIEHKDLPKLSSGSGVRHVVSLGELHPSKNHISVIKILKHIKGVHYHIIGEGSLRSAIENEIQKQDLNENVTLHGHVSMASQILPQFDLFLHPSRTEGLPYVINEAFMAGLPVVARAVGGIPEMISFNGQGRLYSHDSELISILMSFNPDTKKGIEKKFMYDNMITETRNLYLSLLK